jgi:hypothetical protein
LLVTAIWSKTPRKGKIATLKIIHFLYKEHPQRKNKAEDPKSPTTVSLKQCACCKASRTYSLTIGGTVS